MPKGKLFFWACLAFIAGVLASSFLRLGSLVVPGFFLTAILASAGLLLNKKFFWPALLILVFFAGVWRYQNRVAKIRDSDLRKTNDTNQVMILLGVVAEPPSQKENSQQIRLETGGGENLLVVTGRYPIYGYGDQLEIRGKLQSPENGEKFHYQGYLAKEGISSQTLFPQIRVLGRAGVNPVKKALFFFQEEFDTVWRRRLSPPHLGLLEALVFGEEKNIPPGWKDKLNRAGVRHLTAVSGMNITLISFMLIPFFLFLGCRRPSALLFSLFFIWLYVVMIGWPASALRAALMVNFVFLGRLVGRLAAGERALVLAAALMLWQNPLLLRYDLGFQLSFLALAGLIFWQPFFQEKVFRRLPDFFRVNFATTAAAQVFTWPLVAYNFGYFSLVSPLTNLLLVPLVPFLTLAGFVGGSLGLIWSAAARFLGWLFWLSASYLLAVVDFFLKIPFSHLTFNLNFWPKVFLLAVYPVLGYLSWRLWREKKLPWFLNY